MDQLTVLPSLLTPQIVMLKDQMLSTNLQVHVQVTQVIVKKSKLATNTI